MADRLERLVNLTATLLDTRRPLTLEELSERVEPRYPEEKMARRRQFERDKETLRELGIPIRIETVDGFGAEQAYRIHPDDYYLPALALTDAELAALHLAVTAVRLEGDAGREGLAKLGGIAGEGADTALAIPPSLAKPSRPCRSRIAARNAGSTRTAWCCAGDTGTWWVTIATATRRVHSASTASKAIPRSARRERSRHRPASTPPTSCAPTP
jgi:hypothetical protein